MADEAMEVDAPKLNIATVIGEKLTESIRNLDVLSMIKKMIEQVPEDEEAEGVQKKLKDVIEQYNAMSEEEREEFASKMKEALASKLALKLQDSNAFDMSGLETAIQDAIRFHVMLIGGGIILFVILLVFFGYKLYKSIKDKEIKREEKKRAKQMKKKK
ncbi:hypothetical protein MSG28_015124 [Choristoneura fumiferana]|uniref:Uncharacterized protein n=1 Tax=Choristoneura fumiferana TaxID=7141 RepID=A0ACC0KY87_CHOFU|nr:hypothetical protein MSG28_015124 [Choristoneura fumiferana]